MQLVFLEAHNDPEKLQRRQELGFESHAHLVDRAVAAFLQGVAAFVALGSTS